MPPGTIAWASRWPVFDPSPSPHPFIVIKTHPNGNCEGVGNTHSADLFDHNGSLRLSKVQFPSLYPPLTDTCVLGLISNGYMASIILQFTNTDITNHGPPIATWAHTRIEATEWTNIKIAINAIAKEWAKRYQ